MDADRSSLTDELPGVFCRMLALIGKGVWTPQLRSDDVRLDRRDLGLCLRYLIWKLPHYVTSYHQDTHVPPHFTLYNQAKTHPNTHPAHDCTEQVELKTIACHESHASSTHVYRRVGHAAYQNWIQLICSNQTWTLLIGFLRSEELHIRGSLVSSISAGLWGEHLPLLTGSAGPLRDSRGAPGSTEAEEGRPGVWVELGGPETECQTDRRNPKHHIQIMFNSTLVLWVQE